MGWTGTKAAGNAKGSGLAEAREEVAEVEGLIARSKAEEKRFVEVTDSEHWVCLCFRTRADKEAFLRGVGHSLGNGDKYVNGHGLAAKMGVALPSAGPVTRGRRSAKRWADLVSASGAATAPAATGTTASAATTTTGPGATTSGATHERKGDR